MTTPKPRPYSPHDHFTVDELRQLADKYRGKAASQMTAEDWDLAELLGTRLNPIGEDLDALSPEFRAAASFTRGSNNDDSGQGYKTGKGGKAVGYRGFSLHAIVSHGSVPLDDWKSKRTFYRNYLKKRKL